MRRDLLRGIRHAAATLRIGVMIAALSLPGPSVADGFGFQVDNGLSAEQVTVSRTSELPPTANRDGPAYSAIRQAGNQNSGFTAQYLSRSAVAALLQGGQRNTGGVSIIASPDSAASLIQLGQDNYGSVNVIGGRNNVVSAAQVGNRLSMELNLVSSRQTRLVYGQAGEGYAGSITIRNARPGTIIRLSN